MFSPTYRITPLLLARIKQITTLVHQLNATHLQAQVLQQLEWDARAQSTSSSTSIEGNPLSLTQVKHLLKHQPKTLQQHEQEVYNYNEALKMLQRQNSSGLSVPQLLQVHHTVTSRLLPQSQSGKLRKQHVFVLNPQTKEVVFLPPDPEDVHSLVDELLSWLHTSQDLDPLIVAGIFHKQFVVIHPFMDGNGRTVRLLTTALLAGLGIDLFTLMSFENYYNANVTRYFAQVGVYGNYYDIVSDINFTSWLEYFAEGILAELTRVHTIVVEQSQRTKHRLTASHQTILSYLKEHDSITMREYAKLTSRSPAARSKDLKALVESGVLVKYGQGRATYYYLSNLHNLSKYS